MRARRDRKPPVRQPPFRTEQLHAYLTESEKMYVRELCKEYGVSQSSLIRYLIVREYKRLQQERERRERGEKGEGEAPLPRPPLGEELELGFPAEIEGVEEGAPLPNDDFITGNPWIAVIASRGGEGEG